MEMKLYQTLDSDNVINKDKTLKYTTNINLKDRTEIINPAIILNDKGTMNFKECNYCYLADFQRYYFIRSLDNVNSHIWSLSLECDVLESFKDDILNSIGEINRKVKNNDYQSISNSFDVRKTRELFYSDVTLPEGKILILSTLGGGNNG